MTLTEQLPWWVAGPALGVLLVVVLAVANKPLGALGGYVDVVERWRGAPELGWRAWLAIGIVLGGASFALASGGRPLVDAPLDAATGGSDVAEALWLLGAGTLMGFGARTAGGCTSGHGMCGTAMGSPASFVATGTFMGVAVAVTALLSGVMP